jgi:hypothetical protein
MLDVISKEKFEEPNKWEIVSEVTSKIKVRTYY